MTDENVVTSENLDDLGIDTQEDEAKQEDEVTKESLVGLKKTELIELAGEKYNLEINNTLKKDAIIDEILKAANPEKETVAVEPVKGRAVGISTSGRVYMR